MREREGSKRLEDRISDSVHLSASITYILLFLLLSRCMYRREILWIKLQKKQRK